MTAEDHMAEAQAVLDALEDGRGFWRSCSGCYETDEGYPTAPRDPVFGCERGIGCGECGGIGALWDTTDYAEMAEAISRDDLPAPDDKDAEIARLREALADQWRPIETAPNDDTAILVWDGELTIAWWIDGEWMPCIPECPPTHWRPLPSPPTPT